ncbi:MAG: cytochrome c biogenesis protein CcsA [candidate division Zixibacteria bacterium]|nr:cytochrome c biogenesis protein CcsA [candidate division Zixibacteria bacterium]MBU1469298.1 cytochrome c biogenesis protein CcsA [candidate division Zixibacteria bacterium]MBU2624696.1 cytochrome c biogenesis protein CcsA [candidate division Zixibacteria bacterium]
MFFGNLLLSMAFASCMVALAGYILAAAGNRSFVSLGNRAYATFAISTIALTTLFLYQILTHNFQLEYVHAYSSTDLSFFLLLSTLWAGQVGTFVLWLLLTALVGLLIYRRDDPLSSTVMIYYLFGALFLFVLLSASSPFKLLATVPVEGRGLNPLLQNFWMIIHPPIVFVGYTLLAVPFAYAMAALTKNDYSNWNKNVFPWALISSAILGLGIFLGGYWAYETLGWGGYWGWDPVENSSLIPWLTNTALVHGLLVERRYGQLRKSNLLLAALGFLLVMYGTFLTRSGVLADFSVHSFTDLGLNIYLVLFQLTFLAAIAVLFVMRFRSIKPEKKTDDPWSADFMLAIGVIVTSVFAILILVGTSAPLLTRLPFFSEPANVSMDYYYSMALPFGVLLALLAGLAPFLKAKDISVANVLRRSSVSLIIAAVGVVVGIMVGVTLVKHLLLIFFAVFALAANAYFLIMYPAKVGKKMGGHLTHIGFGVLLIGFIGSNAFATGEKVVLAVGEPKEVMGYTVTYTGMQGDIAEFDNAVYLDIEHGGDSFNADPKLFFDSYNRGIMRKPFVRQHLLYDLYIAPEQLEKSEPGETYVVEKGETVEAGDWKLTFQKYEMGSHGEPGSMQVGAVVTGVNGQDSVTLIPVLAISSDGARSSEPQPMGETGLVMTLEQVNPDQKTVGLRIAAIGETGKDRLVVEISRKPLVLLVWLGSVVIVIGTLIATYNRYRLSVLR